MRWGDEKNRLFGEACGYPSFAIDDFIDLSNIGVVKDGDRLYIKISSWGYDGFIVRPENLSKFKKWLKHEKIPYSKVEIKIRKNGEKTDYWL